MNKKSIGQLVCQHLEKISKTGNLIDQIVYKLYGLTDEEIKIVEDTGKE